jgi:hypothetical protein
MEFVANRSFFKSHYYNYALRVMPNTKKAIEIETDYIDPDNPSFELDEDGNLKKKEKWIVYKLDEPYYVASLDLTTDKFNNSNSFGLLKQYLKEFCMLNPASIDFENITSLLLYSVDIIEQNNMNVNFEGLKRNPTRMVDEVLSSMDYLNEITFNREYVITIPFIKSYEYFTCKTSTENQLLVNKAKGIYEKNKNRNEIDIVIDKLISDKEFVHYDLIKEKSQKGRDAVRECIAKRKLEIDNHNTINFGYKSYKAYTKNMIKENIPDLSTSIIPC